MHELTLTKGRASTVDYHPLAGFVAGGGRVREGVRASRHLGILTNQHLDFPDRKLSSHTAALVPLVVEWVDRWDINLLLTLGDLPDHADHRASAIVGRLAAQGLIDVLALRHTDEGNWRAETSAGACERALAAAVLHASQFRPSDLTPLDQYPIHRTASYQLIPAQSEQYAILDQ